MNLCTILLDSSPQRLESNSELDTYSILAKTGVEFSACTELHELRKDNPNSGP